MSVLWSSLRRPVAGILGQAALARSPSTWVDWVRRRSLAADLGKVSIVVVTYNNPEYTRLTLESVLQKTEYANYEIVVVDNGSAASMTAWLLEYAAKHPQVKVILNGRNLGFAAANNIGIRAADSTYVVLLNNDCIVTPGWLTRLIGYLRDPQIGMVGPVTNFAGNEACVNVDYYRLEEIDRFARIRTLVRRGHSFDIPMLAMFCLAMRRAVVEEIGPLDEQFGVGMFEDDDYALRVRQAGYRIVCAEDVFVHHFGRSSFSKLDDAEFRHIVDENRARFEAKWETTWEPPRPRSGVLVEPWVERVAHYPQPEAVARLPATPAKRARAAAVNGVRAPARLVHQVYQTAVPYEKRLIFWSWRRRNTFQMQQLIRSLDVSAVRAGRAELRAILAQYPDAKGIVIFPPSAPWYTTLFQRPQQMALALAALGYVVLYWVEDMDGDRSTRFRKVAERLHLCNVPPSVLRTCDQPIVVTYAHTYNWAAMLRRPVVVYELIDHLDIFTDFPRRMLERYHHRALRRATVVVGTADDLVAALKPSRPDAILCPNGVDLAHFAPPQDKGGPTELPADIRPLVTQGKPIVGYYGALAKWFDFDLVKHAAKELPDHNFVLIGPDYDGLTMRKAGIDSHPNIHWLGPKTYAELPHYLACFDVATIPFKVSDALNAVSPIKLFEYMAGGKPIVSTDLAECRKYPVVLIANSQREWVQRLHDALALRGDDTYLAQLRRTAAENTWQARAQQIICALEARASATGTPT